LLKHPHVRIWVLYLGQIYMYDIDRHFVLACNGRCAFFTAAKKGGF